MVRLKGYAIAAAVSALLLCGKVSAQTVVNWSGVGSGNYSAASNWSLDVSPSADGSQIISFANPPSSIAVTLDGAVVANVLGIQVSGVTAVSLNNNCETNLSIGSSGITMSGGSSLELNTPTVLTASQPWTLNGGSSIMVDQAITEMCGSQSLTIAGDGSVGNSVQFDSGGSTFSGGVTVTGSGTTLSLVESSVMCGDTVMSGPVGTGTLTLGDGTILATPSDAGQVSVGNAIQVGTSVTLAPGSFGLVLTGGIADFALEHGSLVIAGPVTLTGTNTFSGGTTIDCGATLQLGNCDNSGSIENGVTDNGTLVFDNPGCTSFSGITGANGNVTVQNGGTLTLTGGLGANTYGGTTSVTGSSTLQDGGEVADSFSPNSQISLADCATLAVNNSEVVGGLSGSSNTSVTIAGGETLTTNGSCGSSFGGVISGCGILEVGAGDQILTNSNTYGGGTKIDSGATLELGNGDTSGSIENDVIDCGTLVFKSYGCTTFSGITGSNGNVTIEDGMLTLAGGSGVNTYGGTTSITGSSELTDGMADSFSANSQISLANYATLAVTASEVIGGLSGSCNTSVTIGSDGTLKTNGSGCDTFAGVISGCGILEVGSGTQILTNTNTYGGGTIIDSGATLELGNGGTSGSIEPGVAGISDNGSLVFNSPGCFSYSAITGGGSVTVESGMVTLTGTNTYSNGTTIDCSATLQIGGGEAGDSIENGVTDNGTLVFDDSGSYAFSTITGSGGVTIENGILTLNGTNTYHGTTSVTDGAGLTDAADDAFSPNSLLSLSDGANVSVTKNETISGLAGESGTGISITSTKTLTTNGTGGSTYAGVITGTGGIFEVASGNQVLTNSNTYTGGTKIDTGATLQLGDGEGEGFIANGVVDNGTLIFNSPTAVSFSTISGTGGVTVDSGNVTLSGTNSYSGTTLVTSGPSTLKDGTPFAFSPNSLMSLTNGAFVDVNSSEIIKGLSGTSGTTVAIASGMSLSSTGSAAYGGAVTGSGAFEVGSGGNQTLTGMTDNYSGGTTILSGGTLQQGDGTINGAIPGNVLDNGILAFDNPTSSTFAGAISGNGGVTVLAGNLTLSGANTYQGTTNVDTTATLVDGAANAFSALSQVSLNGNANLSLHYNETIDGLSGPSTATVTASAPMTLVINGTATFAGTITGTALLDVGSGGFQTLTGATDNYSGGTTIASGGTLQLGDGSINGTIAGNVTDAGTLAFKENGPLTFSGNINGGGGVAIESGTVTLAGTNGYTNGTTLSGGDLEVTGSNSIGGGLLVAFSSGGTPVLGASGAPVTLSNNIQVNANGLILNHVSSPTLTLNGTISDYGSLDPLTINGPVVLGGNNTYSGATTINGAMVTIATNSGLGTGGVTATAGSVLNFSSSAPNLNNPSFTGATVNFTNGIGSPVLGSLTFVSSLLSFAAGSTPFIEGMTSDGPGSTDEINLNGTTPGTGAALTIEQVDPTYYGTITGAGSLNVSGVQLALFGSNTYTGGTTVAGGLLFADNNSALGTGGLTLNSGAVFGVDSGITITNTISIPSGNASIGGYGTIGGVQNIVLQNSSGITGGKGTFGTGAGASPVIGTLTFGPSATVTFAGGGGMEFSIMNGGGSAGTAYSAISVQGTLDVTASPGTPFTIVIVGVASDGQTLGTANTFNTTTMQSWTLVSAGTLNITGGFNASDFAIDTSNFSNSTFSNFSVSQGGTGNDSLILNFTPVPEPSTWILMACGLFVIVGATVRRHRRA